MTEGLIGTDPLAENWENSISQLTDLSQSGISGAWKCDRSNKLQIMGVQLFTAEGHTGYCEPARGPHVDE
jgi:hypothetical protein